MSKPTQNNDPFDFSALDDLMSSVDHDFQNFSILGKDVPLQPVTILQAVRLVRRFPALLDLFEPKVDPKTGKVLPDHLQPTLMSVVVNAGPDAVAGWVACSARREGDADFEAAFASKPDKLTLPMFAFSTKITLGKDGPQGFFMKVMSALEDAGLMSAGGQGSKAA